MHAQTSSMFQQGLVRRLADWQWHVCLPAGAWPVGRDWAQAYLRETLRQAMPDGTCGASPAPEGAMKKDKTSSDELSYHDKRVTFQHTFKVNTT